MRNSGKISINIRIVSFLMVILCTSIFYISQAKTLTCSRVIDGDTFLVLRFINSVTNLFTQDLVLSEPLPIEILPKYVAVIANRST